MAFNINEFSAQMNSRGFAVNNLFLARITPPQRLTALGSEYNLGNDLVFFCRTVDIPNLDVNTIAYKENGFGIAQQRPIGMDFQPLSTVFMCDSNFAIKRFFHRWMQMVYNYDTEAGVLGVDPTTRSAERTQGIYQLGYKEDYVGTMEVVVFSQHVDQAAYKYEYKFGNLYPTSIGNVQLAWENSAEVMTVPVTFTYDQFKPTGSLRGTVTTDFNRGNGLLNYLSALNTYGQAIDQLSRPDSIQDLINQLVDVRTIFNSF